MDEQSLSKSRSRFDCVRVRRAQRLRGRGAGLIGECVPAYATLGETCGVLREVSGEYREPGLIVGSRIFPRAEIIRASAP